MSPLSPMTAEHNRIGFISTRLAGTDGVSLEVVKWVNTLGAMGFDCFYFAGEVDWPAARSMVVPEAHFAHPDILALNRALFSGFTRSKEVSRQVETLKDFLKEQVERFVSAFDLDLLIVENALSLPMNVPLGLALTEFIAETDFPTIAHHHDFAWERERYVVTAGADYLRTAFPPTLRSIQHVVINSSASRQLALRAGTSSALIPNVMDFETPPAALDDYAADLRAELGIAPDDYLLLQPTRIVPRKRIELAINLARRIGPRSVLLISHGAGDEGLEYEEFLRDYAESAGVRVLFADARVDPLRAQDAAGRKIYSLADAYAHADLVTYPSRVEGFGNAFLEAVYFRRPIVMSAYEIFKADIQPKGFRVVGFDEFIGHGTVLEARRLLEDGAHVDEMVEHNYELGRRYFSYQTLAEHLIPLINDVRQGWTGRRTP
jgi:mannosylglucosylglycerate synthase